MRDFIRGISVSFVFVIALSSCGQEESTPTARTELPYRDISESEVSTFIPFGFDLVKGKISGSRNIIKSDFDGDGEDEVGLFLDRGSDCEYFDNSKFILLKFEKTDGKWFKVDSIELAGNIGIVEAASPNWVQLKGYPRKALELTAKSDGCGSGWQITKHLLILDKGKLRDVTEGRIAAGDVGTKSLVLSEDEGSYEIYEPIWNSEAGEAHFSCHKYSYRKFIWNGQTFEKKVDQQTTKKYEILKDEEDSVVTEEGDCIRFSGMSKLKEFIKSDALLGKYPEPNPEGVDVDSEPVSWIVQQDVNLRSDADAQSTIIKAIIKRSRVVVLDEKTTSSMKWYKVEQDGDIGWVSEFGFIRDDSKASAKDFE